MASLFGFIGTACSVPQPETCARYVECLAYFDRTFDLEQTNTSAYVAEGSCWKSQETADRCDGYCDEALTQLADALDAANESPGPCVN